VCPLEIEGIGPAAAQLELDLACGDLLDGSVFAPCREQGVVQPGPRD
jgi:hypothetical protein